MTISRRHLLGSAAALPTLAMPTLPAIANPSPIDAELIELGNELAPLLAQHFDAFLKWAPLMAAGHRAVEEKYGEYWGTNKKPGEMLSEILDANGCSAAGDHMAALGYEIEPLCEEINETPAFSFDGLRAKLLVVLHEVQPVFGDHDGYLNFPDDGGATESLFRAVAEVTGLMPMVRDIEKRLAAQVQGQEAVQS